MKEQLNLFPTEEETFDFEFMKQELINNLDMLKEMTVQEQTLYKKWQEMNKGGKMSKIKKKLLTYKQNLWKPTDIKFRINNIRNIKYRPLCCNG